MDTKLQAMFAAVSHQRNAFADQVVQLSGLLAEAQEKLAEVEAALKKKEAPVEEAK